MDKNVNLALVDLGTNGQYMLNFDQYCVHQGRYEQYILKNGQKVQFGFDFG